MLVRLSSLLLACAVATPAAAQSPPVQLPLFDGTLVLHGEVGILSDERTDTRANLEVWRPILFGTPERPIGGRMDCQLGGVTRLYTEPLFDIAQRYRDSADRRETAGLIDDEPSFAEQGPLRRLEVTGRANDPHRHYVLTYVVLRDGGDLLDIRLNCTFVHDGTMRDEPDYAAIMRSHIDIAMPVPLPASAQTEGS